MSRKMRDSGIAWIGHIPEEWEVRKLSAVADTITDYVASGSFASLYENVNYLDESDYAMLVRTVDLSNKRNTKPIYIDEQAYNFLSNSNLFGGELILSNIGSGSIGNVYIYTPLYERASLAPNAIMVKMKDNNRYYYYWFLNPLVNETLKKMGGDSVQAKYNKTQLRQFLVVHPSPEEQQKIADYLDEKVSKIDNIIAQTTLSIEEYKRYKQSLILESVTKGLNPDVEMKDSGIEWIGEVPSDWEVKKMKYYGVLDSSGVDKKIRENENTYKSIHYMDVYRGSLTEIENKDSYLIISTTSDKAERCLLKKGDVLFTNSSETPEDMGHSTVIKEDLDNTLFGYHLMRFRPIIKFNLQFEKYLFGSEYMRKWFSYCSIGMTRYGINGASFSNALLIVPPLTEQQQIADYLDKKCFYIDNLIAQKKKLRTELESYKKSLIYECVTGKKEVG